jgi:REP element-mobilizing transposase RayT
LEGYPLFVTFRLAGSLPKEVLAQLKAQRELELKALKNNSAIERNEIEKRHFGYYDDWLDRCESGPRWLQVEDTAQIVEKEIHDLDDDRYQLIAYCIMPNHVHMLIRSCISEPAKHRGKSAKYPVTDSLRLLKGRTARYSNVQLMRTGSFWQHESYDHVIRDEQELEQTILYILNNPVKAGLVREWEDWKFTYVHPNFGMW